MQSIKTSIVCSQNINYAADADDAMATGVAGGIHDSPSSAESSGGAMRSSPPSASGRRRLQDKLANIRARKAELSPQSMRTFGLGLLQSNLSKQTTFNSYTKLGRDTAAVTDVASSL